MQARAVVAAFLLLALPLTIASAQRVLKVPSQYKTIQAAIDAAKDKDTVLVAPGTYEECIDINKTITVTSRDGRDSTTVDSTSCPSPPYSVVTFTGNGILDGFTIVSSSSRYGIDIYSASPSAAVRNCRITGAEFGLTVQNSNAVVDQNIIENCHGPGIWCNGGAPIISGNVITANREGINCNSRSTPIIIGNSVTYNSPDGGVDVGIALLSGNVVANNYRKTPSNGPGGGGIRLGGGPALLANNAVFANRTDGIAGGLYVGGSIPNVVLTNNTFFGNQGLYAGVWFSLFSTGTITNCILRDSPPLYGMPGLLNVTYCDVSNGYPGVGNISADPRFLDEPNGDLHLLADSPCRNKGTNSAIGLQQTDFEADPRIAGGTVDMGADEFFPHLYHTETPTPGGTIRLKFIGNPGAQAYWAFSRYVLNPPVSIPGLQGLFYLNPSSIAIIGIGRFPSTGYIDLPFKFAPSFPKISIPMQALAGLRLTNLDVVEVR